MALAAGLLFVLAASTARADLLGTIWQNIPDPGNASDGANNGSTLPIASFNSTGINYDSRITGYTPNLFLGSPVFFGQANGFDPNASLNNTELELSGSIFLNAGDNAFTALNENLKRA